MTTVERHKTTMPLRLYSGAIKCLVLLWITFMSLPGSIQAQNRPVSSTLQLTPPYSVYLADYARPGSEQMQVYLLLRDLSEPQYDVRLRLTIEGAGIRLQTSLDFLPDPISLEGGVPLIVSGQTLAPYLESRNLLFSGMTQAEYQQRRALPEGFYRFSVEVLDYRRTDRVLSRPATFMAWFTLNEPPRITAPLCGSTLPLTEPANIMFQWMNGGNISPGSQLDTEYELTLVEVFPTGRNPEDAIRSSVPLLQTTTTETSYLYGLTEAALIPGQQYAFRVRAIDIESRDLFKNQGYSQVCTFTYGEDILLIPPDGIHVYAENARKALVNWHLSIDPESYQVEYRRRADKGEEEHVWFSIETQADQVVLRDLEPETTYEVRVASIFSHYFSRYSLIQTFTTPAIQVAACGAAPPPAITASTVPLATTMAGQYWQVGDFQMQVQGVRGGDGIFTGWGVMSVPYLSVQLPVKFENVWVDEDYNLVRGEVLALSEGLQGFQQRWQEEHPVEEIMDETAKEEQTIVSTEEDKPVAAENLIIEGIIADVAVNEAGEIIAVNEKGEEQTYAQAIDEQTGEKKETTLTDSHGNTFVVDKEGKVMKGGSGSGADGGSQAENPIIVQEQLIKEVLEFFKEEINLWLDNNEKGPLYEALIRRLMAMPDCLPKDEGKMLAVLERIEYFEDNVEELIALIEANTEHKERFDFLINKLNGKQPPYREGLTEGEWDELLTMVCPHLLPEEEPVVIEGLSRNADLIAINTITGLFKPDSGRLELTYTIIDTLNLTHTKLEIYKLDEEDTTLVTFYMELPKGEKVEFTDSQDDDKKGWSGKGSDGEFVGAGEYRIKLIAAVDESFINGYEDYEQFEVENPNKPEFPVTTDQLEEIFPNTDKERVKEVVDLINKYSNEYGLTTKDRMAHFLGQIGTETDGLEKLKENWNYSAKNIFSVFLKVKRSKNGSTEKTHKYCDLIEGYDCSDLSSCPNNYGWANRCSTEPDYYFPTKVVGGETVPDFDTWDENEDVKTSYINSSSLFDYVYSCRMDNGAKSTGDGSKYLGKGFIHMTGKDKYKRVSEAWNKKYPNDKKEFHIDDIDELENNVEVAMKASLVLWEEDNMNDLADEGTDLSSIKKVTKGVNGGYNGLNTRKKYTEKAIEVFNKDEDG